MRICIIWIFKNRLLSTCVVLVMFGGKLVRRTDMEVRVGKLRNGKATSNNEVTGEIIRMGVSW